MIPPTEDESSSPKARPKAVTIRRNPQHRALPTPSTTIATATTNPLNISAFPLSEILSINIAPESTTTTTTTTAPFISNSDPNSASLKVFLRVRPVSVVLSKTMRIVKANSKARVSKTIKKGSSIVRSCLQVNDSNSVSVTPPVCDSARLKSEVYTGFSHVFGPNASQDEVYDKMMRPIVEEFLNGRSGLMAALGPSGSGKTHTVFGSAKEPGLIPRALHHIFEKEVGNKSMSSRLFYLSVFEISMEKGKGGKLFDLSPDGGAIQLQQSAVKGLKEVWIKDVAQAESFLAGAKLKRATAITNSNSQSSRSQCIINIRCSFNEAEGELESPASGTTLTFVDLAGAERERKTGNQGVRLLESNFINNTSMVFGLCLRSLLEHQKNPQKPLQKHFQSSLLTRYLRDYLEGRKRMALILTARSGPEDYFDASFLLRQASPYMEIKFHDVEETFKLPGTKKRNQTSCSDRQKRLKLCNADEKNEVGRASGDSNNFSQEDDSNEAKCHSKLGECALAEVNNPSAKLQRDYHVLQGFTKALWNVMKEYKDRVKAMQKDIDLLTKTVISGCERCLVMEKELHYLKSRCSCPNQFPINTFCSTESINSASRVRVLEELTDYGQVASPKMQGPVALECEEKPVVISPGEQCQFYLDHKPVPNVVPEEQCKVSPSECNTTSFSEDKEEKDDHSHFVDEIIETSSSGTGCKGKNIQDLRPAVVCEVHLGDSPSATKTSAFVDEKTEHGAVLRRPFQGLVVPPRDSESFAQNNYQALFTPMECKISHGRACMVDRHEKDPRQTVDEIFTDPVDNSKSRAMGLKVHRENNGSVDENNDKENVTDSPESSFHTKEEAKEISHSQPLKAERPKRRLMPASSLLLRDAGCFDFTDDSVTHRGGRGGQRLAEDECKRTRGSASLLRLLQNPLPR